MNREEALEKLSKPAIDPSLIENEFEYVANKLDIEVDQLIEYLNLPKKYYWDYKNSKNFFKFFGSIYSYLSKTQRGGAF